MPCHNRRRLRSKKKKIRSVIDILKSRELGTKAHVSMSDTPISLENLPFIWRRRSVDPGFRNKIFACQWITNNHVVYGTKCNNLVLYDCVSNQSLDIPLIKSEPSSSPHINPCACGIHAVQLNPSKSLLATGGENVNHIGVYSVADFSPYSLLKDCHNDWIFDLRWLDDSCLASCSRDSSLALWRIPSANESDSPIPPSLYSSSIHLKGHDQSAHPLRVVKRPIAFAVSSTPDDRFRALEYLPVHNTLAVVSMSRRLYLYDALRLGLDKQSRPVYTLVLRDAYQEAVALRRWPSEPNCIALATHHCVLLFDIRCSTAKIGAAARCIFPPLAVSGVRSLNFSGSILSYGTSSGQVHFYDLRADDHLSLQLDIGPGWVKPQTCEEDELSPAATLAAVARQAWQQPPSSSSVVSGWGVPPPPPSPAQPILIAHSNLRPNWGYHWYHDSDLFRSHIHRFHHPNRSRDQRNLPVAGASNYYPPPNDSSTTASSSVEADTDNPNRPHSADSDASSNSSHSSSPIRPESPVRFLESSTPANDVTDLEEPTSNNFSHLDSNSFSLADTPELLEHSLPLFTPRRLHQRISLARPLGVNFFPTSMHTNLTSFSTLSTQLRMLAVYTHEYDPTGTRLFTAGGPIASTFYGNVAALWE